MAEPQINVANTVYAPAGPGVIAKVFDGELTLINLDTGQYFAAGGVAVDVWELVSAGATAAAIVERVSQRYDAELERVATETDRIIGLLLEYGLISTPGNPRAAENFAAAENRKPWTPGWIEVYGDMKELLLLDPIHDVDEAWPKAKQEDAP